MRREIRDIITTDKIEDEIILGERSVEIDTKVQAAEVREITKAIKSVMREKNLKSLSAPAIGYQRRIFCLDYSDLEIKTYINPVIGDAKGLELSIETCSSIPGKRFMRPRNNDITVVYQTPTGKIETRRLIGLAAIVFQHEMDHIDGLLLKDVGIEVPDDYEEWSDEDKKEFAEDYLDGLDLLRKAVQEEIDNDDDLKKIQDAEKFMTGVYKGEIEIAPIKEIDASELPK